MRFSTVLFVLLLLGGCVFLAAQTTPKEQRLEKTEDVLTVNTNLVQVDAVVTDKNGRQVIDLRPEDFAVLENGREQKITAFSYIPLSEPEPIKESTPASEPGKSLPPRDTRAVRPEQVRRVIAILIDDFGLSAESIARLRGALAKFIQEQTSSNDLIAVIRTSGGPGAMQQFTSNRAQLLATVRRLRWNTSGRGGLSGMESLNPINNDENGLDLKGYNSLRPGTIARKEYFSGTLASLGFVIDGLTRFPGRKSIVLVSDNLPATSREAQIGGITSQLDKLIGLANRSSIVISTMDPRGLPKAGLTADDSQHNLAANQIHPRIRDRKMKFNVDQDALSYIAQQTGGIFVHSNNDINQGLRRIVDSEQGYYLIAYRPEDAESTEKNAAKRTYKVTVKLKRPELTARTRSGFHRAARVTESANSIKVKDDFLREALASPFVREDVRLKMTALFTGGSQIKVLLHVDGDQFLLNKSSDDSYKGSFDLVAVAFDDNGRVAGEVRQTPGLNVSAGGYERFRRGGFAYSVSLSVKRPGRYQVRVALRDADSGRLGSDSQLVEVPEAGKRRLTLAGFIVQASVKDNLREVKHNSTAESSGRSGETANSGMELRQFRTGDTLTYSYLIYGAEPRKTNDSTLLSQIRVFRGDKEVFTGSTQRLAITGEANQEPRVGGGSLRLGPELPPGEYFMQVIVTDRLAPSDKRVTDQWIDFQIVER